MGAWIKFFADGSKETGTDAAIQDGSASWSRGKLDDIKSVSISDGLNFCTMEVPDTEWHQFDRMMASIAYGVNRPRRVWRAVQALVKPEHVGLSLYCKMNGAYASYVLIRESVADENRDDFVERITDARVGKWLTAVVSAGKRPYMGFSKRGKINE